MGGIVYAPPENTELLLADGQRAGTKFVTVFAQQNAATGVKEYEFEGSLYY